MLQIQNVVLSFDIITARFSCDLTSCKGACCVEGDAGAPVTPDEISEIEEILPIIWNDLSIDARNVIERQGVAYLDPEGELVTSIVDGKDCVFTCYENGCCYCAIEKAFRQRRCGFRKPLSCHLYPIRAKRTGDYWGLNYDRWNVCRAAVTKGNKNGIPLFRYLREPLVRKFGKEWYEELELTVAELQKQGLLPEEPRQTDASSAEICGDGTIL